MQTEMKQRWISIFLCCVLLLSFLCGIIPAAQPASAVEISYYGREQLAQLNNATALLYAYDQIVAGVEEAAASISVYNGTNALSSTELKTVMSAYTRDHVEHFWVSGSYTYTTSGNTCVSLKPSYTMDKTDIAFARSAFDAAVAQILYGMDNGMSELERELYLHDKLASVVTYKSGDNAHNAYGALVNGTAVCEGYAKALQYLLQRAGIQSFLVFGESVNPATQKRESHAWNYVRIDGKYYHVDATWNDQGETLYHAYFNQTDKVIKRDHAIDGTNYPLPSCTATDAMYFTGKDTYLDSYDVDKVAKLLKNNGLSVHLYIADGDTSAFWEWAKKNISAIAKKVNVTGSYSYSAKFLGGEIVLAITPKNQQPSTETSKPSTETSKPSTETSKPSTETSKPSTETSKPSTETSKPSTETSKPSTETSKPSTETSKPSTETSKPSTETSKPSIDTTEPATKPTESQTESPKDETGAGSEEDTLEKKPVSPIVVAVAVVGGAALVVSLTRSNKGKRKR